MCSHAGCETSFCIFLKCICSHCNDRNCFCIRPVHSTYGFCCCNTIHNRHHDIHQYGIKGSRRITFEVLHCLSSIFYNCNLGTVICQQHFYDFCIKLIILGCQQMQSTNIIFLSNFLILFLFPRNLKRNSNDKHRPNSHLTCHLNTSIHLLNQSPGDRHSQTGSLVNTPGICFFL